MAEVWDVIVIGGGAAGLFAATEAALGKARVLLLERNRRPGVKILASGGSRCNVTSVLEPHVMVRDFGREGARFLGPAFRALPPRAVVDLLHEEGVETYVERFDKIFPKSNRATDVLAAFLRRFERSGARLRCEARVLDVRPLPEGGFEIPLQDDVLHARRVVLACGGQSYPGTGSTGDGYAIAAKLGHTIVPPRPALVPLLAEAAWVRALSGIAFQEAAVRLVDASGRVLARRERPLLFTHFGVSGPAAMDVSREVTARTETTWLEVDVLPGARPDSLLKRLDAAIEAHPARGLLAALPAELPERFLAELLGAGGVRTDRRGAETPRAERRLAVELLKSARIAITGSQGFSKAEVTAGGVALNEVDPRTMESRVRAGFHVCGEVLDVDGPIGGFNFQAAFSTGLLAGRAAAAS